MIKNKRGVTLTELLIVIVVMGIIAAFSVPAVGSIIDNTRKDAVLADSLTIENAAKLYCASNTCSTTQALGETELGEYITGLDTAASGTDAKYIDEIKTDLSRYHPIKRRRVRRSWRRMGKSEREAQW